MSRLILVLGPIYLSQISVLALFLLPLCEDTCSNTDGMVILAHLKRFLKLCVINYL